MPYDHKSIEKKWQERWEKKGIFHAETDSDKEKFYCLIEFPYPSGAGLHIGHPRSYVAMDVIARQKRMAGKNVLYPIGWDAFGLPTENFAIKMGRKPQDVTAENIATFKRQLMSLGLSFDWSREINTTDPAYYKWTQWMFLQFFKNDLAYKAKIPINWCLTCKIGLANEEVVDDKCERCGGPVEQREKEQWMIAITKYAQRLIDDLKDVDYLPKIKKQQADWIGRSEGAEIEFHGTQRAEEAPNEEREFSIPVFTTRADTLFGVTYIVLSPEHPLVDTLTHPDYRDAVVKYRDEARHKSDLERTSLEKEKTGTPIGAVVRHPLTGEELPIWISDYVLMGYGTGAVMGVPAHDERDFDFAQQFGLKIRPVIEPTPDLNAYFDFIRPYALTIPPGRDVQDIQIEAVRKRKIQLVNGKDCYTGKGLMINSGVYNGLTSEDGKQKITDALESEGKGRRTVQYHLRDWVFSRQRYWGEPIPLVHCEKCGWVPVPENELPLVLPEVEKYEPTDTGESPLAAISDWVNTTCPECGAPAKRETDTMPNWAGSSWYFLRYCDPHNDKMFASPEALKNWMPVDWYNGGMEHTTLHLLYSRFWNKFLCDQGFVPVSEPYAKRTSQGLIIAEDGAKMSKSKGNVINPDEIVGEYGADTLRLYEMFMGPFGEAIPWNPRGVVGVRRFLEKVWAVREKVGDADDPALTRLFHKTIKHVTEDIEALKMNTAVAHLMTMTNALCDAEVAPRDIVEGFLRLLCPLAPHLSNEMWEAIGNEGFVESKDWPAFDPELARDELATVAIQVNGKLRGTMDVAPDLSEEDARARAEAVENVEKHLAGKEIVKVIYIPGRMLNLVVK